VYKFSMRRTGERETTCSHPLNVQSLFRFTCKETVVVRIHIYFVNDMPLPRSKKDSHRILDLTSSFILVCEQKVFCMM
jgi:hypothetical protein